MCSTELKRGGGFASFALQLLYGAPNVRKLRERFQRGKMVAVGHQYLTLIVCLTAGICFSSVTTIVYLLIGLASLVLVTCGVSIDLISSLYVPSSLNCCSPVTRTNAHALLSNLSIPTLPLARADATQVMACALGAVCP